MTRLKKDFSRIFSQDLIIYLRDYDSYGFAFEETEISKARLKNVLKDFYKINDFPSDDRQFNHMFPLIFNVAAGTASVNENKFPSCVFGFGGKETPTKKALLPMIKKMSFYAVISGYSNGDYYFNEIDPQSAYVKKEALVKDITDGQFEDPAFIIYFDLNKGIVRDASQEIAEAWFEEIFWDLNYECEMGEKTHDDIPPFIEEHHKDGPRLWRDLSMPKSSPY